MDSKQPIIEVDHVTMRFNLSTERLYSIKEYCIQFLTRKLRFDAFCALKDISFQIAPGDSVALIGKNGSGKSTLVKGLLGLMNPVSGTIEYGDGLTRQDIGYVPQQTNVQRDFPASVQEVVLSGTIGRGGHTLFYTPEQKKTAARAMERLGIRDLEKCCFRELSGGQQQRVRLARAFCAAGQLLLLDEPTAGLDPMVSGDFYGLIEELNRKNGITVIMVSHDMGPSLRSATHVLHIKHHPLFFGEREDYLASDAGRTFMGGFGHD